MVLLKYTGIFWLGFFLSVFSKLQLLPQISEELKGQHSVVGTEASGSHQIVYSGTCAAGWVWLWVKTGF